VPKWGTAVTLDDQTLATISRADKGVKEMTLAYRLHLLGWTQEEIGEVVGVARTTVYDIVENFNTKLFDSEYASGLTPEKIAENHQLDMPKVKVSRK
jgi:hypothetical protein